MESMTLLEGGRNFFSGTYSNDEADFMSQLLGNFSTKLPNIPPFENSSTFWPHDEQVDEASIYISDNTNTNMYHLLQENICSDGSNILFPTSSGESYPPIASLRGSKKTVLAIHNNFSPSSRKRSCSLADVQESRKNTKFSTSPKVDHDATCRQITNIYVSDDDSNGPLDPSPRPKGVAVLNSNGKKRASAGSATDSQSIYAKKRRERINERLRVLQNLVPNGTKVDISTMLEEAVVYVKFLQLQIKLLSSDDLWMYAPIAYNGMDIGLDIKLPSPR